MTRSMLLIAAAGAVVLAVGLPLLAQTTDHSTHTMTGAETPATMAYMEANTMMHQTMAIEFSGDADADFVRSMVPHHQGAVDMARIVLQYGTDPEVRKFAEAVIAAQEAEITWMKGWLAKQGG